MGYKFWCKRCGHNYYTVGSGTWNKRGTVTVYPSYGYCGSCSDQYQPSWSWSGNVVKLECRGCTNKIGVVTWSDWLNRSGETTGYCNGCRDYYLREKRQREERERREREERERRERIARLNSAKTKPHYCPEHYSLTAANWADVEKSIDSWNYLWSHCKIYCKKMRHCVYYKANFNNPPSSESSAGYYHDQIVNILNLSKCPECKKSQEKADQIKKDAKSAQDKLDAMDPIFTGLENKFKEISESKSNDITEHKENLSAIEEKETEISNLIQELQSVKDKVTEQREENASFLKDISSNSTYTSEAKLDENINKLQDLMQKTAIKRGELNEKIKVLNERDIKLMDEENKMNEKAQDFLKKENEANDINNEVKDAQKKLAGFSGAELNAKPEAVKKMNQRINTLTKTMTAKYKQNKELSAQLKECQIRIRKIRAKIKKEKSDAKYLVQLLDDEYNRLSTATDEEMDKYEERTTYFLSVTAGLKQDIVEKFEDVGYELEEIASLDEQQLIDILGIEDEKIREKIMRHIANITVD